MFCLDAGVIAERQVARRQREGNRSSPLEADDPLLTRHQNAWNKQSQGAPGKAVQG